MSYAGVMPLNPQDFPDLEAWIYGRNSQDKNKGLSVPQQVKWGRTECDRFSWTVAQTITDTDIGATRHAVKERPGYLELTQGLRQPAASGKRRVLVTRSSSRANRQLLDFAVLREMCASLGVLWYSGGQLYDMDNPQDRKILAQEAVENEFGPEQNRFDSMQQLRTNFLEGKAHGKEAYGYELVYKRGQVVDRVPCPVRAPIVREMVRRVLDDKESLSSVARWLTASGVLVPGVDMGYPCRSCSTFNGRRVIKKVDRRRCACPKDWRTTWDHVMVRQVLTSETIAGLRAHRVPSTEYADGYVETVPATWEPLITVEDHTRLLADLSESGRRTTPGSEVRWLLTGIAQCWKCLGPMAGKPANSRRKAIYLCRDNQCTSRNAELVEDVVIETVLRRLEDPELLQSLARTDEDASAALQEAETLRKQYADWLKDAVAADLSPFEIKAYKSQKEPAIKAAEARAQAAMPLPHVIAAAGPDARTKWEDDEITPLKAKRDIIDSLLTITVLAASGRVTTFGGTAGVESIDIQRRVL